MIGLEDNVSRDPGPWLGVPELRRLVVALVADFQDGMIRDGRLSARAALGAVSAGLEDEGLDGLAVDEATLGLDSLATIELVTRLNVFFGLDETGIEDYLLVRRSLGEWVELIHQHFQLVGSEAAITFETSGSTGKPKHVRQSRRALESEADAIRLGPLCGHSVPRVLCSVSIIHIYGFLWGVLLPKRLGAAAIDLPRGSPGAMLRSARAGDLILATPFSWDRTTSCAKVFAEDVIGVSSGGPTTQATWNAASTTGLSRLVEVYGASETGGLGWRDSSENAFTLMPDIGVHKREDKRLVRPGLGSIEVQDHLEWVGAQEFHVCGRRDAVVQVAGTNVNLSELRSLIEAEPGVSEAAVRLDGDRLKAFVACAQAAEPDLEDRLRRTLGRLPAPARPQQYTFASVLPRTDTGKLADW